MSVVWVRVWVRWEKNCCERHLSIVPRSGPICSFCFGERCGRRNIAGLAAGEAASRFKFERAQLSYRLLEGKGNPREFAAAAAVVHTTKNAVGMASLSALGCVSHLVDRCLRRPRYLVLLLLSLLCVVSLALVCRCIVLFRRGLGIVCSRKRN